MSSVHSQTRVGPRIPVCLFRQNLTLFCSYLRVKRLNQTFCILCDADQTVQDIKETLSAALEQHGGSKENIRLIQADSGLVLEDDTKCVGLADDTVLHMVFQIDGEVYEAVDVTASEDAS